MLYFLLGNIFFILMIYCSAGTYNFSKTQRKFTGAEPVCQAPWAGWTGWRSDTWRHTSLTTAIHLNVITEILPKNAFHGWLKQGYSPSPASSPPTHSRTYSRSLIFRFSWINKPFHHSGSTPHTLVWKVNTESYRCLYNRQVSVSKGLRGHNNISFTFSISA